MIYSINMGYGIYNYCHEQAILCITFLMSRMEHVTLVHVTMAEDLAKNSTLSE